MAIHGSTTDASPLGSVFQPHDKALQSEGAKPRLMLDRAAKDAVLDGRPVGLRAREYAIVKMLMAAEGRPVSRTDLFHKIWGYDPQFNSNSLEVYVYRIRKKIEPEADHPTILKTVRGIGYRLVLS